MSIDTPRIAVAVLEKVLAPPEADNAAYLKAGAIRNASWRERRIDFQPYPYPSYTEELIRRLKETLIEGDRAFLDALDPATAARELVDDQVRQGRGDGRRRNGGLRPAGIVHPHGGRGRMTASWTPDGLRCRGQSRISCPVKSGEQSRVGQIAMGGLRSPKPCWAPAGSMYLLMLWWVGTDVIATPAGFVRHVLADKRVRKLWHNSSRSLICSPYPGQSAPRGWSDWDWRF